MKITLSIPEQYLVDENPADLGQRIKLYAALRMFQSGEISAGAAAELAGVDRYAFAAACQKHGIPVVGYPAEELQAELKSLRRAS
jgi:predicted HTH domain antitoxin